MTNTSTIIRRTLAAILFFNSTIGIILFFGSLDNKSSLINVLINDTIDTPVYLVLLYIAVNMTLVITSSLISQNTLFLLSNKNLDERGERIKNQIILKSLPFITTTTCLWLIIMYFVENGFSFVDPESGILSDFWIKNATYFVILPILTIPFCIALWIDNEKQLWNPFLSTKQFLGYFSKIISVCLLLISLFGLISYSSLTMERYVDITFNKNKLNLSGTHAKFKIIIDPTIDNGSIRFKTSEVNLEKLTMVGLRDAGGYDYSWSKDSDSSEYDYLYPQSKLDTDPNGRMYINTRGRVGLTNSIFGVPEIVVTTKSLKEIKLTATNSVEIINQSGKCLTQESLKLTIEGYFATDLKLPCLDIKNLEIINYPNQPINIPKQ
jgi:hypothetical protein